MKKIISIALTSAMLLAAFSPMAGAMTRTDYLSKTGMTETADLVPEEYNHNVDADIKVRRSVDSAYIDGPISVEKTSSADFPKFDFQATLSMDSVRKLFTRVLKKTNDWIDDEADTSINDVEVRGEFVVKVTYSNGLSLPSKMTANSQNNEGFSTSTSKIFHETERTDEALDSNNRQLTIKLAVEAEDKSVLTCKLLEDNLNEYLADMTLTCEDVQTTKYNTQRVKGEVSGTVIVGDESDPITNINFNAVQTGTNSDNTLYEDIKVTEKSTTTGGGGGGGGISIKPTVTVPSTSDSNKLTFDFNGNVTVINPISSATSFDVELGTITVPEQEGSAFGGWYLDPQLTIPASDSLSVSGDTVLYGKWVSTDVPDAFNTSDEHRAYINGYPDGEVKPNNNITREEVAAALYRLLTDDVKNALTTDANSFADVSSDRWSNVEISSMVNAGFFNGYTDGSFRPANIITRAEFAAVITRFFSQDKLDPVGVPFNDIAGHWAERDIISAYNKNLVNGYSDGTFNPNGNITRAEAMTLINKSLVRYASAAGLMEGYTDWPDISTSDWYYYNVIEATNGHNFVRSEDKYNEVWTALN